MNRVIITTSDPTYGDIYLNKDVVGSVLRSSNSQVAIQKNFRDSPVVFNLAVAEETSSATYDAFIEAIYAANPGGDTKVILPEGQSISTVTY